MEQSAVNQAVFLGASGHAKAGDFQYVKVKNERMAGTIAAYGGEEGAFKAALSEVQETPDMDRASVAKDDRFGFFDLIDMINPLQHIPLLNIAYQKLTGDSIKPISRIVGGAVFGGPVGAASGIITTVIEDGTGKSPIENAVSLARGDVKNLQAYNDLPPELLSFAAVPSVNNQNYNYNT